MFARNITPAAVLLCVFAGMTTAAPVHAAPLAVQAAGEEGAEPTTASLIADIHLPDGTNRATSTEDLNKFKQALQTVAKGSEGTIGTSEVLVWMGDSAKGVIGNISKRLKENGYTVAQVDSFDSEAGRITPLAAMRGSKANGLVGMWIETKDGNALLVWGRFIPNGPKTATTTTSASKPAAKPVQTTASTPRTSSSRTSGETDAQRRAKAFKAYQDYQYVKYMGPISGSMYSSRKW